MGWSDWLSLALCIGLTAIIMYIMLRNSSVGDVIDGFVDENAPMLASSTDMLLPPPPTRKTHPRRGGHVEHFRDANHSKYDYRRFVLKQFDSIGKKPTTDELERIASIGDKVKIMEHMLDVAGKADEEADSFDDGAFKPADSFDDGAFKPADSFDDGAFKPADSFDDGAFKPAAEEEEEDYFGGSSSVVPIEPFVEHDRIIPVDADDLYSEIDNTKKKEKKRHRQEEISEKQDEPRPFAPDELLHESPVAAETRPPPPPSHDAPSPRFKLHAPSIASLPRNHPPHHDKNNNTPDEKDGRTARECVDDMYKILRRLDSVVVA